MNQGNGVATGSWVDQVFLADDAAGTQNLQLLRSVVVSNNTLPTPPQQPGDPSNSLPESTTVTVPAFAVGNKWIVVQTGVNESFFELTVANNSTVTASPINIPPSLQVLVGGPHGSGSANAVAESAGANAIAGTVTRNGDTSQVLTVNLSLGTGDLGAAQLAAQVPANVTIPAGQASAVFQISTVDDHFVGGNQLITVTAHDPGLAYQDGGDTFQVVETDQPALTLTIAPGSVNESGAGGNATATLTRNTDTTNPLNVTITSQGPASATAPTVVTIPAGAASTTFTIQPQDDGLLQGDSAVHFIAQATTADSVTGKPFANAAANLTVVDDDMPQLVLTLSATQVADNTPTSYPFGIVSTANGQPISNTTDVTVNLFSSNSQALTVPLSVVIPKGANQSAPFALSPVNNTSNLVVGTRHITLTAFGVNSLTTGTIDHGHAAATIDVTDTNGPTLTVSLASNALLEGQSTTGTVSRNTDTTNPLAVTITSSNPNALITFGGAQTVTNPDGSATVTIPAGASAQTFTLVSTDDHVPDGTKQTTIAATASQDSQPLNPGSQVLSVTDADLPDLSVAAITFPNTNPPPVAGQKNFQVTYTVANGGTNDAVGSWTDRVYLSSTKQIDSSARQIGIFTQNGLASGSSYSNTATFTLPTQVGFFYVIVQTDVSNKVTETNKGNNLGVSASINVSSPYTATVRVYDPSNPTNDQHTSPPGTPIVLSGQALDLNSQPVKNALLSVRIAVNGTNRYLTEATDANGNWKDTFVPLPGESGHYSLTAAYPGADYPAEQDHFDILGMNFDTTGQFYTLPSSGDQVSDQVELINTSFADITGLQATANLGTPAVPINVQINLLDTGGNPVTTLPGGGRILVQYTLSASQAVRLSGTIGITVTGASGLSATLPIAFKIAVPAPNLTVQPGSLHAGLVVGPGATPQSLSFDITNNGGAPSGDLTVQLPSFSFLSLQSPATIPSLAVGATATVTLGLDPTTLQPTQEFTGTIAVSNNQTGISVPFDFLTVTTAKGGFRVNVEDESATQTVGGGGLAGATVTLTNPLTNQIVAQGVTDSNGQWVIPYDPNDPSQPGIPEGVYRMDTTAPNHGSNTQPVTIHAGLINTVTNADGVEVPVFLPLTTVTYKWTVVPTQIEDHYKIVLQAEFSTQVPAPVLVVNPLIVPLLGADGSTQFDVNVTNEGLVAADNVHLNVIEDPNFILTPLISNIGFMAAQSNLTIPVRVTPRPGVTPQTLLDGCFPALRLQLVYSYDASQTITQTRDITVDPVFVSDDVLQSIQDAWGTANGPLFPQAGDLNAIADPVVQSNLINLVVQYSTAPSDTYPQGELTSPQVKFLDALAGGLTGTADDIAAAFGDVLGGMCSIATPPVFSPAGGGGGGFGGSGGGGGGFIGASGTPVTYEIPTTVNAQVRIKMEQDAVLTRNAFLGTLEIDNGDTAGLTEIGATLDILSDGGHDANSLFFIQPPVLTGLTGVDGTGTLAGSGSGTAVYTFIPTTDAAPTAPKSTRSAGPCTSARPRARRSTCRWPRLRSPCTPIRSCKSAISSQPTCSATIRSLRRSSRPCRSPSACRWSTSPPTRTPWPTTLTSVPPSP